MTRQSITHKDVAAAAGVSTFAVSQALSGKAGVSGNTRERVLQIAEQLGYRTNPAASLLAKTRKYGGNKQLVITRLAIGGGDPISFGSLCTTMGVEGREALINSKTNLPTLLRYLWNTGVNGLYISFDRFPISEDEVNACDWSRFSVVKSGRIYPRLPFHLVRHSAFDYMRLILSTTITRGYKRIAVLLRDSGSLMDDEARLGAVMVLGHKAKLDGVLIDWIYWTQPDVLLPDQGVLDWLHSFKPDAIVAYNWLMIYPLMRSGYEIPKHVGFAAILSPSTPIPEVPLITGCEVHRTLMDQRAVASLCEMIARSERGIPKLQNEHVIEPTWIEGDTLPRRN